jgi:inositol transport system ATP-binding protein
MINDLVVNMKNISKCYPGVRALDKVDFQLYKGRVTALMGENGAGKSTLMKVLAGIVRRDAGTVVYRGREVQFHNPGEAIRQGIAMIHQELSALPELTVAENIFLGREFHRGGWLGRRKTCEETRKLLDRVGLEISPMARMGELSVSQMQLVEIAKAISFAANVIIMDEPTSAITMREVERLFAIIRGLCAEGRSVVYITHKMDEVFQIADFITVFRDGRQVGSFKADELDHDQLVRLMVNRDLTELYPRYAAKKLGATVLKIERLSRRDAFADVSFEVRAGEILGLAGLLGAGRTDIVEAIFGLCPADGGKIFLHGRELRIKSPAQAIAQGIALVTEDRKSSGLVLEMGIRDNMSLASLADLSYGRVALKQRLIRRVCEEFRQRLRLKMHSQAQPVSSLSGGNQQKVVLAKWLMRQPRLVIFDEPTRGIDVGAKSEFYHLIAELAAGGAAVIFISSEMPEILGMCDRIITIYHGHQSGEVRGPEATQELLLKLITKTSNKGAAV